MRCCRWIVFSSALVREYYYTISLLEKFDSEIKLCIGVLVSFMKNTKIRPQNCISQFSALIQGKNFFIHLCIFSISQVKIFPNTGWTVLGSDEREVLFRLTFRVTAQENGNMVIKIFPGTQDLMEERCCLHSVFAPQDLYSRSDIVLPDRATLLSKNMYAHAKYFHQQKCCIFNVRNIVFPTTTTDIFHKKYS